MTSEEAIRLLGFLGENWHGLYLQALDMAITALREQGERSKCEWCAKWKSATCPLEPHKEVAK